ncbi:putative zinc-binding protein [Trinickia sp.]|uniref:putative zinc-binding protein n=1 Tax=Trinickia sp. TaxID=2571163 RepID=UPI003F7D148F
MNNERRVLPLVYSCSGCSSAAQMANYVAVQLDRRGSAEMSCIAGVGGDVPALLKLAHSGRPIIAIDGCALACVKHSLERHGIAVDEYVQLAEHGVKKRFHADFDPQQAEPVIAQVQALAHALNESTPSRDEALSHTT